MRCTAKLSGMWRWIYVVTALVSLYLNCFVLVIQTFLKVPPLHAIAPGAPPSGPVFRRGAAHRAGVLRFHDLPHPIKRFHPA